MKKIIIISSAVLILISGLVYAGIFSDYDAMTAASSDDKLLISDTSEKDAGNTPDSTMTITVGNLMASPGNIGGTTAGTGTFTTVNTGQGANELYDMDQNVLTTSSPTFVAVTAPTIIGGTGTTSDLNLKTTSGVGTTGADMHFLVGNNGATEAMTVLNSGNIGIGTTTPSTKLNVIYSGDDAFSTTFSSIVTDEHWGGIRFGNGTYHKQGIVWQRQETYAVGSLHFLVDTAEDTGELSLSDAKMTIYKDGNVGIGTTSPNQKLTIEGAMSLKEQAAANTDVAAYGQLWVKTATPNELYFTDDAGTDTQISSHPMDAPEALYLHGPGVDWIGKRVQKYLGVIFWQTIDGNITEETFDAYNLRTKDLDGHVDLIKLDWDKTQLAKLEDKAREEVVTTEIPASDAFESVEITEEIPSLNTKVEYEYVVDGKGKVDIKPKDVPVMEKVGTGKFKKQLKTGVSFSSETGKFMQTRHITEHEIKALNLKAPEMPKWMKEWSDKHKKD